ncbi:nucleotidyltransferase family protein [Bacillus sp. J33]|uniref:nucleotidyltransferase family protein n=1 Tax=Bacillus sp. J33 TaxID=935836 RepID=UPI0004789243|nr:nucleotidyltransferase family protein [Bacillus sp. J33]
MGDTAILLAGGQSSRMGQLKGLLPWQGRTLFEFQIETLLKSPFSDVITVLGYRSELFEPIAKNYPVKIIKNNLFHTGKCSSIIAGLKAAGVAQNILISAVDQPASKQTIESLYSGHAKEKSLITVPVYKNKRGHPVLFSKLLHQDLLTIKEESKGLRSIFQKYKNDVLEIPVNDSGILLNLNTLNDYKRALTK